MENSIKSKDGMIELCMSDVKKAGRAKIKMSALRICETGNYEDYNKNGLHWEEKYCNDNKESAIGMDYVVSFLDGVDGTPSGHGNMTFDENGNIVFEDSVSVGHVEEVVIEDLEVDGITHKLFNTLGYINTQRYPRFYEWLKTEIETGRVCGSIEINGKGDNPKITYLDDKQYNENGSLYMGRTPQIFDFSGLAILCKEIEEPADDLSIVMEINTNQNATVSPVSDKNEKGVLKMGKKVETNNLSLQGVYDKVYSYLEYKVGVRKYDSYVVDLYLDTCEIVVKDYEEDKYYLTTYSIADGEITFGDVTEVESAWKSVSKVQAIEINKKEGNGKMELEELQKQVSELNSVIVEANKSQEELNKKCETAEEELEKCKAELNAYKEKEAQSEAEAKKTEVNSYMENEISKNGFTEAEINSFVELVGACDLDGIKKLESELCTAKFKAEINAKKESEVNSKEETNHDTEVCSMFTVKEPKKVVVGDEMPILM